MKISYRKIRKAYRYLKSKAKECPQLILEVRRTKTGAEITVNGYVYADMLLAQVRQQNP